MSKETDGVEHAVIYCQTLNGARNKPAYWNIIAKINVKEMVEIMTENKKN